MLTLADSSHFDTVAASLVAGKVVPFLGAGVNLAERPAEEHWSRGRYLPDSRELAEFLAGELDYDGTDPRDLLRVSQHLDIELGLGRIYETLHDVFDADYKLTAAHRLLASLPARIRQVQPTERRVYPLYVTTNYDDGLERAFHQADEPFDLITYIAEGPDQGRFLHVRPDGSDTVIAVPKEYGALRGDERPIIAKIHGAVDRTGAADSFVITENHYISYLSRTEISQLIPVNIMGRMVKSHFLFLGYSLRDWNLRVILQRVWSDAPLGYKSWAVQPKPDRIDEMAWIRQNVELVDARLAEYTGALDAAIDRRVARVLSR